MINFLGVLGGMGPLATADFLRKIAENTPAKIDQQHIPIVLYSDCTTPDRTENILRKGLSPLPHLLTGIRFLNQARVKAICIPCNTAHNWFSEIEYASEVPVLHIAKASISQIKKKNPEARVIGVMSTFGTHQTGIYRDTLVQCGYEVLYPTDLEFEDYISPGIALVKSNLVTEAEDKFKIVASALFNRGAEIVILGCTEIPIGMQRQFQKSPALYIDSAEALALAAVELFSTKNSE